jgi:peptidoglycan/LPS O-acetylase OafA/YrhL
MPEPVRAARRYMPGLDGLRAVAVLGVIAYHLGVDVLPGGLLGVGVFFTLSGYLITDLLLAQADQARIQLKPFWLARARRLLPALLLMLTVVTAWVTVIGPHQPADFRSAVVTGVLYVNNWWLIVRDVSYFEAFAAPPPLNHLWSLSVEEQFYVVWPLVVMLAIRYLPEVPSPLGVRVRLAALTLGLALASAVAMVVLYTPGIDPSRVYYGTDTRAFELLIGAALAMVWPSRRLRRDIAPQARRVIDGAGVVGLAVVAIMFWRVDEYSPFLYRGGFVLLSVATALAVATLAHPASRLGPILGCRPLRWVGERSYGIYLWHFPIVVLTTPSGTHEPEWWRATLQLAATFGVSALSWRFVEDPIRHGALGRLAHALRSGRAVAAPRTPRAWATTGACGAVLVAAAAGLAGVGVKEDDPSAPGMVSVAETVTVDAAAPVERRTTCDAVVHIGDSTSEGLVSPDYLPKPRQRISARYGKVGATTQHIEIQGGRSIYERFQGQPNATEVAQAWIGRGFDGCWVLALGTNEAANVGAGSTVGLDERIDLMMGAIGRRQPVLWVNTKSLVADGPYAAENMAAWGEALLRACDRHPNMRVYDWASDVRDEWFIADGIHFTTPGYAARAKLIAAALLQAFPRGGALASSGSADCLVRPVDVRLPREAVGTPGSDDAAPTVDGPASASLDGAPPAPGPSTVD